jgi:hypothetical protein
MSDDLPVPALPLTSTNFSPIFLYALVEASSNLLWILSIFFLVIFPSSLSLFARSNISVI